MGLAIDLYIDFILLIFLTYGIEFLMTSQPYLSQGFDILALGQLSGHTWPGPMVVVGHPFFYYFTFYLSFKYQLLFYYVFIERTCDIFVGGLLGFFSLCSHGILSVLYII